MKSNTAQKGNSRREFFKLSSIGLGAFILGTTSPLKNVLGTPYRQRNANGKLINAYCIDFNWGEGGPNAFARPGLWADANPTKHIQWYHDLGCNVVQTFAVSSNGYAWYKNGVIPEQPGLKHDFLPEMVKRGREKGMKVFGYFCAGANTKWGLDHPELSYEVPSSPHIPLTTRYLDYLCSSIEDALIKTDMDGFMVDWLWNPVTPDKPLKWLACEQEMYEELMGKPFPGPSKVSPEADLAFRKKAIDRAWTRIMATTKKADPSCVIWLSCSDLLQADIRQSIVFKQVDWLMNEAGDLAGIDRIKNLVGNNTQLLTCLARWNGKDPTEVIPQAKATGIGLYGFTKPRSNSLPAPVDWYLSQPVNSLSGDDKNIAAIARAYNQLPLGYVK